MTRRAAPHRGIDAHYGEGSAADERPSKTQLKTQALALQKLGAEVADLSEDRLERTAMPEALREAILEFRRTRSHEGRRRQLQFIGKLMRTADEAVLREAVAEARLGSARETLLLHEVERWRDALIADDAALTQWQDLYPWSDAQRVRSLVRAARRDAAGRAPEARQPHSARELFQYLKPFLGTPGEPSP